jgi:4-hydroxyphenylacetate 3-monooxygenase oxygenase component
MPAKNGRVYLDSLRDGRELYARGERIADVTTHAAFKRTAETLAGLFDLQYAPDYADKLTYRSPISGDPVPMSYLIPTSRDDLVRRRVANRIIAEWSYGNVTRTANLVSQMVTQWAMNQGEFAAKISPAIGERVWRYYEHCRENDVVLTHAIVSPQYDRRKSPAEQEDPYLVLGKVRETDEGIVVRGARMLATHAPYCNEVLVWPFERLTPQDTAYALWFACPLNAPGLKLLSREPYGSEEPLFDRPLSSRFDEGDCVLIFDDVLIPWDRVFVDGLTDFRLRERGEAREGPINIFGAQQTTRALVKAEFMYAVASGVAEAIGIDGFLHVQQMLGEMLVYVDCIKGMEKLYESQAIEQDGQLFMPADAVTGGRDLLPHYFQRMAWILREICGAGQVMTPSLADFNLPELRPYLDKYFRGKPGVSAVEKVKLFKLAWELASDKFGSRATIYEYYHSGDPVRNTANVHVGADKARYRDLLSRVLQEMDADLQPAAELTRS